MIVKKKVYSTCLHLLEEKIQSLQNILKELEEGAENDNKSSAGDKHETARAMMQLEQEKISRQLGDALEQKASLEKLEQVASDEIRAGSLIETNKGFLYLGVGPAKISVDGKSIAVLSAASPLGKKLLGLTAGGKAEVNGSVFIVESVQ